MKVGARPYQAGARYRQESGSSNSRPEAGARNGIEKSSQSQTGVRHRQGGNQMKVGARPYQVGARYRQESCRLWQQSTRSRSNNRHTKVKSIPDRSQAQAGGKQKRSSQARPSPNSSQAMQSKAEPREAIAEAMPCQAAVWHIQESDPGKSQSETGARPGIE